MMEWFDQSAIERLIINTLTMLCKNSIQYSSELHIQGTLGITVDASSIVLIHMNERFGCDTESSNISASVPDERGSAESVLTNSNLSANSKRPRMSSVVQCARRPFGRGRGRVPVRPVRRVRSGHVMGSTVGFARYAHQQLRFPSPSSLVVATPSHTSVTPRCKSPQFQAGHVPANNIPVSKAPQPLTPKLEVEERQQSATGMTQRLPLSGVIYVDSDDETETAAEMKPDVSTSVQRSVSEGQSQDALQRILDTAVLAARAGNIGAVRLL